MRSPDVQESRKGARIIFHGVVASPFNLQGIKPAIDIFEGALQHSAGRKVLYMESPESTAEDAQRSKTVIENHGLVDPILGNIFRARGIAARSQNDLDTLKQMIVRAGTKQAIEVGLVPPTMAREYFWHKELQRVREEKPFEVEYESHTHEIASEISAALGRIAHLTAANLDLWSRGEIGQLVENQRKIHETSHRVTVFRIPDVVSDLTRVTEVLLQTEEGGLLFIPFTAGNRNLVQTVRGNFWENANIEVQVTDPGLEGPEKFIIDSLQSGTPVADEVYAQHFLETAMSASVKMHARNRRQITSYMESYEALERTISEIATSFTLAEIQNLAKMRKDLVDVLRNHPLSAPLLPFISRLLI